MRKSAKPLGSKLGIERTSKSNTQKNMKLATTAKLPKKASAKVNDPDNPGWTEDMLGKPVIKRGRGPQAAPTKPRTSVRLGANSLENAIKPFEKVEYKLDDLVVGMTAKNRHDEVSIGTPVGKEAL
jgi:hypothetical protein